MAGVDDNPGALQRGNRVIELQLQRIPAVIGIGPVVGAFGEGQLDDALGDAVGRLGVNPDVGKAAVPGDAHIPVIDAGGIVKGDPHGPRGKTGDGVGGGGGVGDVQHLDVEGHLPALVHRQVGAFRIGAERDAGDPVFALAARVCRHFHIVCRDLPPRLQPVDVVGIRTGRDIIDRPFRQLVVIRGGVVLIPVGFRRDEDVGVGIGDGDLLAGEALCIFNDQHVPLDSAGRAVVAVFHRHDLKRPAVPGLAAAV